MVIDPNEPYVLAAPSVVAGLDYWRELEVKQQPNWPDAAATAAGSGHTGCCLIGSDRQASRPAITAGSAWTMVSDGSTTAGSSTEKGACAPEIQRSRALYPLLSGLGLATVLD